MAGDETPVPAEHGGRFHDQHHASESRPVEGSREHSEDGPVGRGEPGTLVLSLQHQDLMAKGEDLGVTLVAAHQQQPDTGNEQSEQVRQDR